MTRLLITDGHVRPEPDLVYEEDPRTGRSVLAHETHYAPTRIHLAFDPETGLVYAATSEEEAVNGPQKDEETPTEKEE